MTNPLLTPAEVAKTLGVTEGTLSVWRCTGRYPLKFVKVGRRVMYRQIDIDTFVNGRVYEHTL
ncbi:MULTISPECIES: helix-turn-helix domain-containing protein [Shewanella]|uniref:DNA-binding protein n=2 Tax=Bacteria TaxID=2 RepID=A0AAC9TYV9_9GAMM|nr:MULTISPECIES: helix-turn-helix domain-containing protein [Shewanella]ASJ97395.1 DNA-binding protein [Shewanella marisflavi]OXR99799.1 excisionase [Shewanella algae]PST65063.1 excisionase [Shewanella algae]PST65154.1 excisionase [Shewanella algae]QYJ95073.1 helix-turn-helix domain-containing protein [Shewanella spartinae]